MAETTPFTSPTKPLGGKAYGSIGHLPSSRLGPGADALREALTYNPETGAFHWRATGTGRKLGVQAGRIGVRGYRQIGFQGRVYYAHRLAWLWMTGAWPDAEIDHVDTDKLNNAWENLRVAGRAQNQGNVPCRSDSASQIKGVARRQSGRWRASIRIKGRAINLGTFDTADEASAAYAEASQKYFGEFGRVV